LPGQERRRPLAVLVAERDPLVRLGIASLLRPVPGLEVADEAGDLDEALAKAAERAPDVLLCGSIGDRGGVERLVREAAERVPAVRTLVLGTSDNPVEVQAAFAAGAAGFLVRRDAEEQLEQAIVSVVEGRHFLDPNVGGRLAAALAAGAAGAGAGDGSAPMTARELQVLALLSRGLTNCEIGARLGISHRTVERHRTSVAAKLGRRRRSELVEYAREHNLD
jgi:DNA-binding NarL/FixJ family response regulator